MNDGPPRGSTAAARCVWPSLEKRWAPPARSRYSLLMVLRWILDQVLGRKAALLAVGAEAPEFEVQDHLGETVAKRGLLGRRYVLWFFPKAGTPG